ncbi:MAG: DnaA regulatory inactivator Hda [Betaproteobacteria bacterium]|jgi:DnaA family protein|nr:DnaA regulatory inactivator Hda [Betaproteobacteria bacterium]
MRQLVLEIAPPRAPTLDNFVAGDNAELLAHLRAMAGGASAESMVYLWGDAGCGRSHLLQATRAAAREPQRLWIADDVDRLAADAQIDLFNRINAAREDGGAVLAAGPLPPAQLALREDLRSRLGWGLVYQVRPLSDEQRAVYLREEAARRGLRIADEVIWYLLAHVRRDLPTLVSLMAHLDGYSLSHRRPLTLPLVRAALSELEAQA